MASGQPSTGPAGPAGPQETDWAGRATRTVETFVETVRDKSLRPALVALKMLGLGLVAALLGLLVLVLVIVGVVRLLTVDVFAGRVWGSDLVVGGLLVLAGAVFFRLSRRTMKADSHV